MEVKCPVVKDTQAKHGYAKAIVINRIGSILTVAQIVHGSHVAQKLHAEVPNQHYLDVALGEPVVDLENVD